MDNAKEEFRALVKMSGQFRECHGVAKVLQ